MNHVMARYITIYNVHFCVLTIAILNVMALNQHMICKSVDDVFTDTSSFPNGPSGHKTVQGLPGKRGEIGRTGDPGLQGLKGEPGYVDYNNISDVIVRKVDEGRFNYFDPRLRKTESSEVKDCNLLSAVSDHSSREMEITVHGTLRAIFMNY